MWAVGIQQSQSGSFGTLIEHFDGKRWSVVPSPNPGKFGNQLYGVAAAGPANVWAVGQSDDATHEAFPLIEHLSHGTWTAQLQTSLGSGFSDINGVAVAGRTVWIVGEYLDAATGLQHTLVARSTGSGWQQVPAPNPGTGDKTLGGISATGTSAWAVGYFKTNIGRSPLIEVHKPR